MGKNKRGKLTPRPLTGKSSFTREELDKLKNEPDTIDLPWIVDDKNDKR